MAGSWKIGGGGLVKNNVVGKRLQLPTRLICSSAPTLLIPSSSSLSYSSSTTRQDSISAAYEKNPDDQAPPSVVLDELILPESEEYWAPDPQTGVFTPPSDHNGAEGEGEAHSSVAGSVLEEEAFFRPTSIEDLEKPITVPDLEVNE